MKFKNPSAVIPERFFSISRRSPDDAKIKQKMVYASSREALKRALVGIAFELQATDKEDVEHGTGESHPQLC